MHKGSVREDAVFQELPVGGWGRADHRLRRAPPGAGEAGGDARGGDREGVPFDLKQKKNPTQFLHRRPLFVKPVPIFWAQNI